MRTICRYRVTSESGETFVLRDVIARPRFLGFIADRFMLLETGVEVVRLGRDHFVTADGEKLRIVRQLEPSCAATACNVTQVEFDRNRPEKADVHGPRAIAGTPREKRPAWATPAFRPLTPSWLLQVERGGPAPKAIPPVKY